MSLNSEEKHVTFHDTRSGRSICTFPQLDTWNLLLLAGVLETFGRFVLTKILAMPTEENRRGNGTSEMCRFHQ